MAGDYNEDGERINTRTDAKRAQDYENMLGSVSVINNIIATHNKGSNATSGGGDDSDGNPIKEDFGYDLTHDEKKERVSRSNGYLVRKKALEDWGDESFTEIDKAISAANSFTS